VHYFRIINLQPDVRMPPPKKSGWPLAMLIIGIIGAVIARNDRKGDSPPIPQDDDFVVRPSADPTPAPDSDLRPIRYMKPNHH
jgi:hypothetical protein